MTVLKDLTNIFCGGKNFFIHLSIFSIIGIFTLALFNLISYYIPINFFGFPPKEYYELSFSIFIIFITSIYLCGYLYNIAHLTFFKRNSQLPDLKINIFASFAKIVPIMIVWGLYFTILFIPELILFNSGNFGFILYFIILNIFLPFINMIFISYSKSFKPEQRFFSPLYLPTMINKTFIHYIKFLLITLPVLIIIMIFLFKGFIILHNVGNSLQQLSIRILITTTILYVIYIYHILFVQSATKWIEEN